MEHIIPSEYQSEAVRLESFQNWTVEFISKEDLACYGFYYVGPNDCVKCHFCKVQVGQWKPGDSVLSKHAKCSQCCPLLWGWPTGNIPLNPKPSPKTGEITRSNQLDGTAEYRPEAARIESFLNCPVESIIMKEPACLINPEPLVIPPNTGEITRSNELDGTSKYLPEAARTESFNCPVKFNSKKEPSCPINPEPLEKPLNTGEITTSSELDGTSKNRSKAVQIESALNYRETHVYTITSFNFDALVKSIREAVSFDLPLQQQRTENIRIPFVFDFVFRPKSDSREVWPNNNSQSKDTGINASTIQPHDLFGASSSSTAINNGREQDLLERQHDKRFRRKYTKEHSKFNKEKRVYKFLAEMMHKLKNLTFYIKGWLEKYEEIKREDGRQINAKLKQRKMSNKKKWNQSKNRNPKKRVSSFEQEYVTPSAEPSQSTRSSSNVDLATSESQRNIEPMDIGIVDEHSRPVDIDINSLVLVESQDTNDPTKIIYEIYYVTDPQTSQLSEKPLDVPDDVIETIRSILVGAEQRRDKQRG